MSYAIDVVELLKDLVRIPSLSYEEGKIADYLEGLFRESRTDVFRKQDNVCVSIGSGENVLLLNSHLDVVPPSENHPYDPFDAVVRGDSLFGRGSVDAKGSVAAMSAAVLSLVSSNVIPENGRLILALTTCEEQSKDYNGLQDVLVDLPRPCAALVGEPTEMNPCIAQKGLLILNLYARGRTAHAARGHLGVNAIVTAARDIQRLSDYSFDRTDPELGKPSMHVTMINGGTAHNVIPDLCKLKVDIRSTPAYTHRELVDEIQPIVESDVEVHSERIIPVRTHRDERIVQSCVTALPERNVFGSPTTSDWIFLEGVPTVKIGPGKSELSHTPDEQISISHLQQSVGEYIEIIKTYFAG